MQRTRKIRNEISKTLSLYNFLRQVLTIKKPRMAYLCGWLGHQNLGDETLLKAAEILFPQCGLMGYPDCVYHRVSFVARHFGLFKYGLFAGGTLINRTPAILESVKAGFAVCKHNIIFGSGVINPSFWAGRTDWEDLLSQWKPLLERCRYIGVRGPISAKLLTDAGVSNVEVVGDPILALADDFPSDNSSCIPKSIGLNISHAFGNIWGTEDNIRNQFTKLATLARNAGWKVRWFVVIPGDLEITKTVAKATGTDSEIYTIYSDYQKYLDLVRSMSVFVGVKLHAVALATCAYVPSIMLEYRPKCRDYMSAIGQGDATIRTDEFQANKAWEIIQQWNGQREILSKKLFESIKPMKDNQFLKAAELLKML